jgi:hypothetical protein
MGYLTSGSTIYARAYLTAKGRELFFNKDNVRFDAQGNDLFEIRTFTLGDPDVNYQTLLKLPAGLVPDVSGSYDGCLKTSLDYEQRHLLFYQGFEDTVSTEVEYNTNQTGNILNVNINLSDGNLPIGTDVTGPVIGPLNPTTTVISGNPATNTRGGTTGSILNDPGSVTINPNNNTTNSR